MNASQIKVCLVFVAICSFVAHAQTNSAVEKQNESEASGKTTTGDLGPDVVFVPIEASVELPEDIRVFVEDVAKPSQIIRLGIVPGRFLYRVEVSLARDGDNILKEVHVIPGISANSLRVIEVRLNRPVLTTQRMWNACRSKADASDPIVKEDAFHPIKLSKFRAMVK